jgi:hypothetical protein
MISVRKPDGSRPSALLPFSISRRDNQIYDCCGLDNDGEAYLRYRYREQKGQVVFIQWIFIGHLQARPHA